MSKLVKLGLIAALVMTVAIGVMADARQAEALDVGEPAPEWQCSSWINGSPTSLADLRGKTVFVEFWAFT